MQIFTVCQYCLSIKIFFLIFGRIIAKIAIKESGKAGESSDFWENA
jgi:hypothetical protein